MQETVMEVVCINSFREDKPMIGGLCPNCGTLLKENEPHPRVVIGRVEEVVLERAKWPNE